MTGSVGNGPDVTGTAVGDAQVGDDVAVRETHSGVVLLLGDRAYKFKKPVDLPFLDFRSRAARQHCCAREVVLNRRLAPDVYLGVGELTDPAGESEPAVVMRRMPESSRLTRLVRAGRPLDDIVDRLARVLADFHSTARRGPEVDAAARPDMILQRWDATFRDVRRDGRELIPSADLDLDQQLVRQFLTGRTPLFDDRIRRRRIVDGHGDLLCDDIFCLPDGPRVLDCLEFDDRLRFVDGLDDIAFLAMDLERLGASAAARTLIDRYTDYAGDPAPASLTHHYVAYRAFVRVKVACLRHRQGDPAAGERARSLADLARRHLWAGQVRLILVGGLPGSGKSTVAGRTADALGGVLLSSDVSRRTLADRRATPRATAPSYRHGIYDRPHTDRLYGEILQRAARLLAAGETVVVDASFTDSRHRAEAARVARSGRAELVAVRCTAPAAVRAERIRSRPPGPSEATPIIAERMARDADPWPESIELPTTGPVNETIGTMVRLLSG